MVRRELMVLPKPAGPPEHLSQATAHSICAARINPRRMANPNAAVPRTAGRGPRFALFIFGSLDFLNLVNIVEALEHTDARASPAVSIFVDFFLARPHELTPSGNAKLGILHATDLFFSQYYCSKFPAPAGRPTARLPDFTRKPVQLPPNCFRIQLQIRAKGNQIDA